MCELAKTANQISMLTLPLDVNRFCFCNQGFKNLPLLVKGLFLGSCGIHTSLRIKFS